MSQKTGSRLYSLNYSSSIKTMIINNRLVVLTPAPAGSSLIFPCKVDICRSVIWLTRCVASVGATPNSMSCCFTCSRCSRLRASWARSGSAVNSAVGTIAANALDIDTDSKTIKINFLM